MVDRTQDTEQGIRYPLLGFWTSGAANTKQGYGPHPYKTFSFDAALRMAQIENFNISTYSSVLPLGLGFIDIDDAKKAFIHGGVLEVILAGIGVTYSASAAKHNISIRTHGHNYMVDSDDAVMAAASCVGRQIDVSDGKGGPIVGGYVAEYVDTFPSHVGKEYAHSEATKQLNEALDHICNIRGFDPKSGTRTIEKTSYVQVDSDARYGYTLNGYGFVKYGILPAPELG